MIVSQSATVMKGNKTVDFSNVYSPKSQTILSKGHNILTLLSKAQKLSPRSASKTHSPLRQKQLLINIPNAETYRLNSKVILTTERIRQIHDRLDIDTKTSIGFELRSKKDEMYFNTSTNPFTREFRLQRHQEPLKATPTKNVLTEMTNLRNISLDKTAQRITHLPTPAKDIAVMMQKQRERVRLKLKDNRDNMDDGKAKEEKVRLKNQFEQLDEIIQIKEESFFVQSYRNQDINIFLLITQKEHPHFRSNKEILQLQYFNLDSMVVITHSQKQKFQCNCLNQISAFSRDLARSVKVKKLPEKMGLIAGDLRLNIEKIDFEELLLIASGKLKSAVLLQYLREEEEDANKKMIDGQVMTKDEQRKLIVYAGNTRNRIDNFDPIDQMKTEIQYYGKSEYTKIEQQQRSMSKSFQEKLKRLIDEQTTSKSKLIRDRRVVETFQMEKEKLLVELLDGNVEKRLTKLMKEVERKIRMNKVYKNRTEKVKIDILAESCRIKKQMEGSKGKRKSPSSRGSSFSPLKTWRG